jgi:hypothetical protein
MSHFTLHLSIGMLLGAGLAARHIVRAFGERRRLSCTLGRALLLMYLLGAFATIPHWLSHLGVPAAVCRGWWMNAFILNPAIGKMRPDGGMLIGQTLLALIYAAQYVLLLAAIRRARPRVSA